MYNRENLRRFSSYFKFGQNNLFLSLEIPASLLVKELK
jgi:hypothetical protein